MSSAREKIWESRETIPLEYVEGPRDLERIFLSDYILADLSNSIEDYF
jgi:hypothetical protein